MPFSGTSVRSVDQSSRIPKPEPVSWRTIIAWGLPVKRVKSTHMNTFVPAAEKIKLHPRPAWRRVDGINYMEALYPSITSSSRPAVPVARISPTRRHCMSPVRALPLVSNHLKTFSRDLTS